MQNFNCIWPLSTAFVILIIQIVIYYLLAVYLDNVLPDENGEGGERGNTSHTYAHKHI
jgi:hypothetical protein